MNEEFLDEKLNSGVTVGSLVDVFDDARMVCWSPEALVFGVWYGGATVNIFGCFNLTVLDCFTDTNIQDAHDARRSFQEWIMER
jgi:hypothetical protein